MGNCQIMFFLLFILLSCSYSVYCMYDAVDIMYISNDVVGSENFTYHKVHKAGRVIVSLRTLSGDADIYVSQKSFVNYDPLVYDLSSTSCGHDVVEIPSSFQKPFIIGIYGHPSYEQSQYALEIFNIPETADENEILVVENYKDPDEPKKKTVKPEKEKKNNQLLIASTKTGLWALLEIIHLIFT